MAKERVRRRLVGILASDVVGYTRLMEADEVGTLATLRKYRKSILAPLVSRHQGRIIKLMGDGTLIEFPSVVEAVRCAADIQHAMAEFNAELPENSRLELRIGVNLGDVIVEGQDIYGDGVNIASRLEGLSDRGGILISGTAFDQVEGKVDFEFEFLGDRAVKNIERPVRVYRVRLGSRSSARRVTAKKGSHKSWFWPTVVSLVLAAGGAAIWSGDSTLPIEPASKARMEHPLPDKPSIAVLPFLNMSNDAGQEHFADGITDDLITDLSKVSELFVIARNSTFVYKNRAARISQVAEELGVRYVVEGSVRRAGDQVRVNAQLIDALTGGHVWADRFDGSIADIFAVQDEFVSKIVGALRVNLTKNEKEQIVRARTDNIAAKVAFEEGWNHYLRFNAKDNAAAVSPLQRAIKLDPEYGRAYAALASVYARAGEYGWLQDVGLDELAYQDKINPLVDLAKKYPTALAYAVEARDHAYFGRSEEALQAAGQALALEPNDPEAHIAMAWALTISGKPRGALNFVATAMRLNPNYPSHYVLARGIALFAADQLTDAAEILERGFSQNRQAAVLLPPLASVLARLGRRKEARHTLLIWQPGADQLISGAFGRGFTFPFRWEPKHSRVRERLMDGFQLAALPLEITVASLVGELTQSSPFGRQIAAQRLGWFGPAAAGAVPVLVGLLQDEIVRKYAAQSLAKIGPGAKQAIPVLVAIQNESIIGHYAKDALKEIRGY